MLPVVRKAFIYLTRHDRDLLLLSHPHHPEVGLQVPAGTINEGEAAHDAAARELVEETGLTDFHLTGFLGESLYDMRPFGKEELHRRLFYHAVLTASTPERWRYAELDGGLDPIELELFWWSLQGGDPDLIAGHGIMIHNLKQELTRRAHSG
jgi:8-oxo-dGTP diphosphatase